MLISLDLLVKKYNIRFSGVLHVGAHECEELPLYEKYIPRSHILWVEALPDKVAQCKSLFPGIIIENAVVSDKVETVTFHRSNNGQSSSILDLGLHKVFHPHVWYIQDIVMESRLLDDILVSYGAGGAVVGDGVRFNFLNFDIQGAELKAFKGMEKYLSAGVVDYIYTEVNSDYVYNDCAIVGEIDMYLGMFGFVRVETVWYSDCRWGDAFYVRTSG